MTRIFCAAIKSQGRQATDGLYHAVMLKKTGCIDKKWLGGTLKFWM
jgi:hypothetical protein